MSLCVILAFSLTSCTSEDTNTEQRISVAEVTRSLFYAPFYVAIQEGFFVEKGLNIELTTTWGGDKTMTTLLANGADIALIGAETTIYVYAQDAVDPVINFAQLTQTDGTFLVARNKADDFSWDDVKGSTFLGQRKGGMPQMVGEYVLKQKGIDPQEDLELIQNIEFANIASAFATGTGDYVQLFEPQASVFEKEGVGHVVASFGLESGFVPYTVFMAKQSYMEENEEVTSNFTAALHEGQKWVQNHTAQEIADVVAPYFEDIEASIMVTVIDRYKQQGSYAEHPLLDEKEWNHLQDIMQEAGELPEWVEHEVLVNTSFANTSLEQSE